MSHTPVLETTLSIIKPDAVRRNIIGSILEMIESCGYSIIAQKRLHPELSVWEKFYAVHQHRPFFKDLCANMAAGPVHVQVLQGPGIIEGYRTLMGATRPEEATPGTIRQRYGQSVDLNSVHGSDSPENAKIEIAFFFSPQELFPA